MPDDPRSQVTLIDPAARPAEAAGSTPLVSVFMFVRNGAATIRRAIDSVLAQTYPNIEFIIQDGASTDETLDILRGYGDRLKVVSEPDSGPSDGLWRALNRCSGEFIGSCQADEELLPDAVARAVAIFAAEPEVGSVTGDAMITDVTGRQTGLWTSGPFNLVDYLMGDYCPYFCSSFFRRQTLLEAGLKTDKWGAESVEFELWCRLAALSTIKYVPGILAKYATHPDQSSNKPGDVIVHMRGRLNHIIGTCSDNGFLGANPLLCVLFIWGHARCFCNHAMLFKRPQVAESIYLLVKQTLAGLPKVYLDGIEYDEDYVQRRSATAAWNRICRTIPFRLIGLARSQRLRARFVSAAMSWLRFISRNKTSEQGEQARVAALLRFPPPPDEMLKGRMYAQLALRYEARHRLNDALRIWQEAAALRSAIPTSRTDAGF
jgi:glycosyltransferase involved in cell wall biosynthesis